ncbi:MAG TPA: ribonuclease P protein component [Bryobacteraceae bacterium]|nr:ribonuclease P protein component [Bryobacteraceae bacterium]
MNARFELPKPSNLSSNVQPSFSFPKKRRLLRSKDFRRVYDHGSRFSGPLFTAFLLANSDLQGPRIGFTVPRALGRAVRRNRMRRRVREAIRLEAAMIGPQWDVVINPRKALHDAPWEAICREVRKLVLRCGNS